MLLLTDRMSEGVRLQQVLAQLGPCLLAALHHPGSVREGIPLVVCDVALDTVSAVEMLRAALGHLGLSSSTPVLCLLRDPSHLTQAQARLAGATATLPFSSPATTLLSAARTLLDAHRTRPAQPAAPPALVTGVQKTGALISDILDSGLSTKSVVAADLDRASGVLLGAIEQAGIQAWLDVVWNYDDVTYQHCLLVAGLAAAFAIELGLPPKSQNLLSQAALVHDIGKAQIPRPILNKAGPLTPEEAALMRSHPARGYAMLARQGGIDRCLLDAVLHHHEYLDGSGYPDALRGSQISRLVRMVTICDIYAALIEHRPYKAALAPKAAMAALIAMGPRLDTNLVGAFRNVVRDR